MRSGGWRVREVWYSIPSFDLPIPLPLLGANGNGPADGDPTNINKEKINTDRAKDSSLPSMFFWSQGQGQNNNQIIFLKADKQSYTTTKYIGK